MAKLLLLLVAEQDAGPALEQRLASSLRRECGEPTGFTVQLMREVAEDFFHDPATAAWPRPQLVLELVSAPGRPLRQQLPLFQAVLAGAPLCSDQSLALVMHEHRVIPCPPQDIYYHYLMRRAEDFSQADYLDYYLNCHASFGRNTPAIAGYSQNIVDLPGSRQLAGQLGLSYREVTSISELKMPSLQAFVAHPEVLAIAEPAARDEARFVDRTRSVMFNSEVVLRLGDFTHIHEPVFQQHFPA